MNPENVSVGDTVMIDILGYPTACNVIAVDDAGIKLCESMTNRIFSRTFEELANCKLFDGSVPSLVGYPDWLLKNRPDVKVHFLSETGVDLKSIDERRKLRDIQQALRAEQRALAPFENLTAEAALEMLSKLAEREET